MSHQNSSERLEIVDNFVFVAVVTILCIRGFLLATGFPQLGGAGLHIAHVLWGGIALTVALLISLLSSNPKKPLLAILGGIGFGFFIDEVGKFVTSSNNYFFSGAFFLIYSSIMLVWLISRMIIVRIENRPFFMNAEWPKKKIERSLIVLWALIQVVGAIPIALLFALRNEHFLVDILTSFVILVYALMIALSLVYICRRQSQRGARMMQRSILLGLTLLVPVFYFKFAIFASISAIFAILVMINLSEVSLSKIIRLQQKF